MADTCRNCHSRRRSIKTRDLCSKCHYWQGRVEDCSAKLEFVRAHPEDLRKYRPGLLFSRMRKARRVLEELQWREEGLLTDKVDAQRLEALLCGLARDCRSTVAANTSALVEKVSPKSRRQIYEVLLTIVENFPSRRPNLHSLERPIKVAYRYGGWSEWSEEDCRSHAFSDEAKLNREFERAYY